GYCRPARESIAARSSVTDRTVDKAVRDLEAAGLLRVRRGLGRHHVNEYQAVLKGEPRSRFSRSEKANDTPLKGEPRSHEPVRTSTGRGLDGAPVFLENCLPCGAPFKTADADAFRCEPCKAGESQ